jgi:hypothetical protein
MRTLVAELAGVPLQQVFIGALSCSAVAGVAPTLSIPAIAVSKTDSVNGGSAGTVRARARELSQSDPSQKMTLQLLVTDLGTVGGVMPDAVVTRLTPLSSCSAATPPASCQRLQAQANLWGGGNTSLVPPPPGGPVLKVAGASSLPTLVAAGSAFAAALTAANGGSGGGGDNTPPPAPSDGACGTACIAGAAGGGAALLIIIALVFYFRGKKAGKKAPVASTATAKKEPRAVINNPMATKAAPASAAKTNKGAPESAKEPAAAVSDPSPPGAVVEKK